MNGSFFHTDRCHLLRVCLSRTAMPLAYHKEMPRKRGAFPSRQKHLTHTLCIHLLISAMRSGSVITRPSDEGMLLGEPVSNLIDAEEAAWVRNCALAVVWILFTKSTSCSKIDLADCLNRCLRNWAKLFVSCWREVLQLHKRKPGRHPKPPAKMPDLFFWTNLEARWSPPYIWSLVSRQNLELHRKHSLMLWTDVAAGKT